MLTESQFREVIERATRSELRDPGISLDILRQVAEELEIDPKELQQALHTVLAAPEPRRPVDWTRRIDARIGHLLEDILPRTGRSVVGALIGGSLGWFSAYVAMIVDTGANAFIDVPVAVTMVLLTVANSLGRRLDGRFGRFVGETAAMGTAFGVAWALTHGDVTGDLATWVLSCIAAATAWGWLVVRNPRSNHPDRAADPGLAVSEARSEPSDHARSQAASVRPSGVSSIAIALALPHLRRNDGTA